MAGDRVVKKRLLEKLQVTRQSLDGRVKTLQKKLPMSKEDALYLIAFNEQVKIDDQLDPETLERVGRYHTQLSEPTAAQPRSRASKSTRAPSKPKNVVVKFAGIDIEGVPGLTAGHAHEAKLMAERVYPILYVFENSARDIIERVLTAQWGGNWWEEVSWSEARRELKNRQEREGQDAWHSKRGDSPLAYLDLSHLVALVGKPKVWPYFESIFPRENWFAGVVDDLTVSRRVIAHMNPLTSADIEQVEAGFRRWVRQIKAKADLIP